MHFCSLYQFVELCYSNSRKLIHWSIFFYRLPPTQTFFKIMYIFIGSMTPLRQTWGCFYSCSPWLHWTLTCHLLTFPHSLGVFYYLLYFTCPIGGHVTEKAYDKLGESPASEVTRGRSPTWYWWQHPGGILSIIAAWLLSNHAPYSVPTPGWVGVEICAHFHLIWGNH